jgi:hypothetical protein
MALVPGVNSFVSVQEFDDFCGERLDMAAAFNADVTAKSAALVSATDLLNELPWTGVVVDPSQQLAFPRSGWYFDPRRGGRVSMEGIPARIKQATFELAHHLLANEGVQDSSGGVRGLQVGPISLSNIRATPVIPSKVSNIIRPILVNQGASGWWRAN